MFYYIDGDGNQEGPIARDDMRALIADGIVQMDTQVAKSGQGWKDAAEYPDLRQAKLMPGVVHPALMPRSKKEESSTPGSFGFAVIVTLFIWPIGLLFALVYLCDHKTRSAGFAMVLVSIISAILGWIIWGLIRS